MNKTSIVCAVLAGTLGFGTLASAQDWRGSRDRDGDRRTEQRHERRDYDRRDWRRERHDDRYWNRQADQQRGYVYNQPAYVYNQPAYVYNQPAYVYNQPRYDYDQAPRYHRGGYLPRQYLGNTYYVNNWQAYPGLYAPPYGYQWVDTGSDFVLAALATGLIANLLAH